MANFVKAIFYTRANSAFCIVRQFSTFTACGEACNGRSNGFGILEAIDLDKHSICFSCPVVFNVYCVIVWGERGERENPLPA